MGTLGVLITVAAGLVWLYIRQRPLRAQMKSDTESSSGADEDEEETKSPINLAADTPSVSLRSEFLNSTTPRQGVDPLVPLIMALRKVRKSPRSPKKSWAITDAPPPYQN
ncbi:hypothetical protein BD779DRAFT_582932 [Infundibulicybe gibba]|nr:hypothetical protein BD779DRAFT_582932 [Infundibulicybe gibba]